MSAIRFEHVFKSFDEQVVLRDFSMEVQPAETKVILGGSGSGKTTILKMVLGLVKPDSGRVFVEDQDITDLDEAELMPIRRKIGMVFQEGALFDSLTVGENVAYQMREDGTYREEQIEKVVRKLLGFVDLEDVIDKFTSELSGGMRRRVGIARALVGNPRILLYDSPTAGLDPITGHTICELVIRLRDLEGVSSIFVTHNLESAMTLASEFAEVKPDGHLAFKSEGGNLCLINTRFVMLKDGTVLFEGSDEALKEVDDEYIQEFLT
ncbi:ATP-binding cassette domain-containing protein [Acidobacteria bacterium AH-259-A15]|nr:ATP-binding cassette domain-containing protein [Acidobacteria bacterium AH-259-A15]